MIDGGSTWDIYWKSPAEIQPPAFEGERLFASFDLSHDDDEILYHVLTELFFGHEEVDKACHSWFGGEEKGLCLVIYDAHLTDATLLLSEYGVIMTFGEIKKKAKTITIKEKY
jgi:hypothetical protein